MSERISEAELAELEELVGIAPVICTYEQVSKMQAGIFKLVTVARERDRLREALTPSAPTKAAYIGEFQFDERSDSHLGTVARTVPWTTVKEIMEAIRERAGFRIDEAMEVQRGR